MYSLKIFFYKILSFIIIKSLKKNNKIAYYKNFGFGDSIFFYLLFKLKKIKTKSSIFCFTKDQFKTAQFFLNKKDIRKLFILIPNFIDHVLLSKILLRSQYFKPIQIKNFEKSITQNLMIRKIIKNNVKKNLVSSTIKKITNQKYVCLFVKHYHSNCKKILPSARNTADLKKIEKLINYLLENKIRVIILGNNTDKFPKYIKKKIINPKLLFFNEISKDYSLNDQFYLADNCHFYIGSASGTSIPYYLLNKNILHFDTTKSLTDKKQKNIKWLYKKIRINKKLRILDNEFVNSTNKTFLNLKENTFNEIVRNVKNFL